MSNNPQSHNAEVVPNVEPVPGESAPLDPAIEKVVDVTAEAITKASLEHALSRVVPFLAHPVTKRAGALLGLTGLSLLAAHCNHGEGPAPDLPEVSPMVKDVLDARVRVGKMPEEAIVVPSVVAPNSPATTWFGEQARRLRVAKRRLDNDAALLGLRSDGLQMSWPPGTYKAHVWATFAFPCRDAQQNRVSPEGKPISDSDFAERRKGYQFTFFRSPGTQGWQITDIEEDR